MGVTFALSFNWPLKKTMDQESMTAVFVFLYIKHFFRKNPSLSSRALSDTFMGKNIRFAPSNFNQDLKAYNSDPKRRKTLQVLFTNKYRLPQTDIDECRGNLHNCHHLIGTCINTAGSFYCTCKPGFEGDGIHICKGKKASSNQ